MTIDLWSDPLRIYYFLIMGEDDWDDMSPFKALGAAGQLYTGRCVDFAQCQAMSASVQALQSRLQSNELPG